MNGTGVVRAAARVLVLTVFVSGCATRTMTGDPPKEKGEVATIRTRGNYSAVDTIDGKAIPLGTGAMQVEPGEHLVAIRYEGSKGAPAPQTAGFSGSFGVNPKPHTIKFTAKKGCEYELGYPTVWFGRKPYVKNLPSGTDLAASLYVIDPKDK